MRNSSASSLPLSSATEIISTIAPGKSVRFFARLLPSGLPSFTRSIDSETASTSTWLPIERRATLSELISGTPALSKVPSMRVKRAIANCASSGPTIHALSTKPSQARRPTGELNQLLSETPATTRPTKTNNP